MGIVAALIATLLDPINWVLALFVFLLVRSRENKALFAALGILLSTTAAMLIGSGMVEYSIHKYDEIDDSFSPYDKAHIDQIMHLDLEEFTDIFNERAFEAQKLYLETRERDCRLLWNAFLDRNDSVDTVYRACTVGNAAVTAASQLMLVGVAMVVAGSIARRRIQV